MKRFGVMLGITLLSVAANAPLAQANNAKNGIWISSDDCGTAMALSLTNIGGSALYTADDNKSWFVLPGAIASDEDKVDNTYHDGRVVTIDGVKLKAAVKYFSDKETLLVVPTTENGHKKLADLITGNGKTTIKYGLHTITGAYPSIKEGKKAIADCKMPL